LRERRALSCSNVQNSIGAFGGALTVKAVHKLRRIGGRHALIGGVQAADMLVIQTAARADEYFVQGPVASVVHPSGSGELSA